MTRLYFEVVIILVLWLYCMQGYRIKLRKRFEGQITFWIKGNNTESPKCVDCSKMMFASERGNFWMVYSLLENESTTIHQYVYSHLIPFGLQVLWSIFITSNTCDHWINNSSSSSSPSSCLLWLPLSSTSYSSFSSLNSLAKLYCRRLSSDLHDVLICLCIAAQKLLHVLGAGWSEREETHLKDKKTKTNTSNVVYLVEHKRFERWVATLSMKRDEKTSMNVLHKIMLNMEFKGKLIAQWYNPLCELISYAYKAYSPPP